MSIIVALVLISVVIFTCFKCLYITVLLGIVYVVFYPKIQILNFLKLYIEMMRLILLSCDIEGGLLKLRSLDCFLLLIF